MRSYHSNLDEDKFLLLDERLFNPVMGRPTFANVPRSEIQCSSVHEYEGLWVVYKYCLTAVAKSCPHDEVSQVLTHCARVTGKLTSPAMWSVFEQDGNRTNITWSDGTGSSMQS